jgi:hypothetical protein
MPKKEKNKPLNSLKMKSWLANLELDELCSIQNMTSVVMGARSLKLAKNTKEKSKQCFTC